MKWLRKQVPAFSGALYHREKIVHLRSSDLHAKHGQHLGLTASLKAQKNIPNICVYNHIPEKYREGQYPQLCPFSSHDIDRSPSRMSQRLCPVKCGGR